MYQEKKQHENKFFYGTSGLAIATAMALNLNISSKTNNLSDTMLTNIEALAVSESSEEFYEYTGGCEAVWDPTFCEGTKNDGTSCKHSYSTGSCNN